MGVLHGGSEPTTGRDDRKVHPSLVRDLVALTKPRVISLLLVTAVAPMYITGLGAPPFPSWAGCSSADS